MPTFPIMATDDEGTVHRIGRDDSGQMWTACGSPAGSFKAILAYNPDCLKCIERLAAAGEG